MVKHSKIALVLPLALLAGFSPWLDSGRLTLSALQHPGILQDDDDAVPFVLSETDRALYQTAFRAQKRADWKQADQAVRNASSSLLMGHVLAERYLHRQYQSTPAQLAEWLKHYRDLPQAHDIYQLALAKSPALKDSLPEVAKPAMLSGYGDNNTSGRFADTEHANIWRKALDAWRNGNKSESARLFVSLAGNDKLSPSQASAAAYWAYRALSATNDDRARDYLKRAAEDARGFYGILARKQLHMSLDVDADPVELSESDVLKMMRTPAIRRAIALSQAGASDLAEQELRVVFPQADTEEKLRLLALAHRLHLASAQITMARSLSSQDRSLDYALYPIPRWQPHDGFKIEPALIYALARQESGFRASAVSSMGAAGIMQLMPQTASMMQKRLSISPQDHISEPVLNITLGQNYVQHLLENGLVDGNVIYMLTAYNAGAGRLQNWKQQFGQDDPLLFVESIPFTETRAYVMQVMANYWVYSELAGRPSRTVSALIAGRWPSYEAATPLALRFSLLDING